MKQNITTALAVLTAIIVMTAGCRKKEENINIRQHYYVNFSDGSTSCSAYFATSESNSRPVILGNAGRAKINGMVIGPNFQSSGSGSTYTILLDSATEVTFTLELKDKTLTNSVSKSVIGNSEFTVDSVFSVGDTIRVRWNGGSFTPDEVIFSITGIPDSTGSGYGVGTGTLAGETFTFDPAQTKNLVPGTYTIDMTRQKTLPLQQSDNGAGGEINVSVYSSKTVVLQ